MENRAPIFVKRPSKHYLGLMLGFAAVMMLLDVLLG
jgi:hypothetical protein